MTNLGFRADLHMHSTFSDGTLTPQELLQRAKKLNLSGLSITDHDCVDAYTPDLYQIAHDMQLQLMTGVEFSCREENSTVHILGYGLDPQDEAVKKLCTYHVQRRFERNQTILERLRGKGIFIDYEQLAQYGKGVIGRPHIALALMQQGVVQSMQEAFDRLIGDGKPCYDSGDAISVKETIQVIHQAKGKAFLAHPHLMRNMPLIKRLIPLGLDGIEVYYARFSPAQERVWYELAQKHQLMMSGGSDFHGDHKENNPMGCSWVAKEAFDKICQ